MDVWSSQGTNNVNLGENKEEEDSWEISETGKDALIVLVDVREAMFSESVHTENEDPTTWFHSIIQLLIKLMKSKIVANDNSLLSIVFFGSHKKTENDVCALEHIYEFQALGFPSAQRIKELQMLIEMDSSHIKKVVESMANSDPLSFSHALWHCGISFSGANLKKKDVQRIWIFTNDDQCVVPDTEETSRIQKQVQNHMELKRVLNLFYIIPPNQTMFDLSRFYSCVFKDFSIEQEDTKDLTQYQPAFPITSLDDLMETSLRKRFRKRRLTSFPLYLTKTVSIGVELYALKVIQRKSTPLQLDASTNVPLKSETRWLCEDTGMFLTPDQMKKYIEYGGKRIYFSRDDIIQIKYYDTPGLQLICFKPLHTLSKYENIRAPYFIYPCDGYIEGSSTAFVALMRSMVERKKYALARLIARKTSEPRLVALVPQEEVYDELGQVQPSGFHVIFLPYVDDIRDVPVEATETPPEEQVHAAKQLIAKLTLSELPTFENPDLQKHYASIQALALGEELLEFTEADDTTLPDKEGFTQPDIQAAIRSFQDLSGDMDKSNLKRKEKAPAGRKTSKKKVAHGNGDDPEAGDAYSISEWSQLVSAGAIQKKTVADLKGFLHAHGLPVSGRKADLIERVTEMVNA